MPYQIVSSFVCLAIWATSVQVSSQHQEYSCHGEDGKNTAPITDPSHRKKDPRSNGLSRSEPPQKWLFFLKACYNK